MSERIENNAIESKSYEFNSTLGVGWFGSWEQTRHPTTVNQLKGYLLNPQVNNQALRNLAWYAYTANGVIRNVVDYMCSLPTLSKIVYTKDKKDDGSKPIRYTHNKAKFDYVLDTIKHTELCRDSILRCCNDGVSFYYFVTDQEAYHEKYIDPIILATIVNLNSADEKKEFNKLSLGKKRAFIHELEKLEAEIYPATSELELNAERGISASLFPLPVDYTKIVGISNNHFQIAFDLFYFNTQIGAGLKRKLMQYPKFIRDQWKKFNLSTGGNRYLVLPVERTIVCKTGAARSEAWGRPVSLAALYDILYLMYYQDTKRGTLDTINNKVIYQTFPASDKGNTSTLSTDQQRDQHNTIKNALHNRKEGQLGLSFFSLAPGTKLDVLNTDTGILETKDEDSLIEHLAGDMGFAAALLNGVSKGNYASLKLNMELVSSQVMTMVKQFERELVKVINYNVIKDPSCWMELDYLNISHVNRGDMIGHVKELYLSGRGAWRPWVESVGLNFESFIAMLEDEQGMDEKFQPHLTSYTMTERDIDLKEDYTSHVGGRPSNSNSNNESTVRSQQSEGGEQVRPNV